METGPVKKLTLALTLVAVVSMCAASQAFSPFSSISHAPFSPFQMGMDRSFSMFVAHQTAPSETPPPQIANADKLALAASTAVGTKVNVQDAIVVTGPAGEPDSLGIYVPVGPNQSGLPGADTTQIYQNFTTGWTIQVGGFRTDPSGGGANTVQWAIFRPSAQGLKPTPLDGSDIGIPAYWGDQGSITDTPEQVSWSTSGPVDRPPFAEPPVPSVNIGSDVGAIQQLAAPDTSQAGVYLTDPDNSTGGIYTSRGYADDLGYNSTHKKLYGLLGQSNDDTVSGIMVIAPDSSTHKWATYNQFNTPIYYSDDNVDTPDLVTSWKKFLDHTTAPNTVTNVTKDDLGAGIVVSGAGFTEVNRAFFYNPPNQGRPAYGPQPPGPLGLYWDGAEWSFDGSTIPQLYYGPDTAFPFGQTFTPHADAADPPAPTITKSRPAGESNWQAAP